MEVLPHPSPTGREGDEAASRQPSIERDMTAGIHTSHVADRG